MGIKKLQTKTHFLIVFILLFFILILQSSIIQSLETESIMGEMNNENINWGPQPVYAIIGTGPKFITTTTNNELSNENVNLPETKERLNDLLITSNKNKSSSLYIDSEISEAFNNQDWNYVRIKLVDNSEVNIPSINILSGTREEKKEIINQLSLEKNNWFDLKQENLILELSADKFKEVHKSSLGITTLINLNGYNKLLELVNKTTLINNNIQIGSVNLIKPQIVSGLLDESTQIINVNPDVWNLGLTGDGIKVCIIDSGVNSSQPYLSGKIIDEYCYCSAPDANLASSDCCPDGTAEDTRCQRLLWTWNPCYWDNSFSTFHI